MWDSDGKMLAGLCYISLQEGSAETTSEELTAAPTPCFPVPLGGRDRQTVIKLSLRKGSGCLRIWVYFSLPYSDFVGNKFSQAESVLPITVIDEGSFPVLVLTHKCFIIFSLPCPAQKRSDRTALVGT